MHGFTQASLVKDGKKGLFALYRWDEEAQEEKEAGRVGKLDELVLDARQAWTHRASAPKGETQIFTPTHGELVRAMGEDLADFGGAIRVVQVLLCIHDQRTIWRPTVNVRGYKNQILWDALFKRQMVQEIREARRAGAPQLAHLSAVVVGVGAPEPMHDSDADLKALRDLHSFAKSHAFPFSAAAPVLGLVARQEIDGDLGSFLDSEEEEHAAWAAEWPDPPARRRFGFNRPVQL